MRWALLTSSGATVLVAHVGDFLSCTGYAIKNGAPKIAVAVSVMS